ncbi:hypothetical protein A5715_00585 [Mycolicibacter heraklionensis]|nr:hypothetical protein A5715_00585 [Mycolicibacter heraklionensis]
MRRRRTEEDRLEVCADELDAPAVYAGGRLIGFNEFALHELRARRGDDCGEECRAAGHIVLI